MSLVYVAGVNSSDASKAAARFAARLAAATEAELVAVCAYPIVAPTRPRREAAVLQANLRGDAVRILQELDVPGVGRTIAYPGSPAGALTHAGDELGASLIAVGATHRGPLGRVLPGSVGERLLNGAPCPVAVVPPEDGDLAIETIGVAYDDSVESRVALREAGELALRLNAKLVLLTAVEPMPVYGEWPGAAAADWEVAQELRAARERDVRAVAEGLSAAVPTDVRIFDGPAGRSLAGGCASGIDLLFAGSRGYGPLRAVLAGSVSRHLVDHAPCPVIVVPRGATAELEHTPVNVTVGAA